MLLLSGGWSHAIWKRRPSSYGVTCACTCPVQDNARLAQASLIARQEPTASGGEQQGGQQQHGAVSSSVVAWNSLAALSAQASKLRRPASAAWPLMLQPAHSLLSC